MIDKILSDHTELHTVETVSNLQKSNFRHIFFSIPLHVSPLMLRQPSICSLKRVPPMTVQVKSNEVF